MTVHAVLLRGVNVGPNNRIAMPAFRSLLERLGCTDVRTYLQSGNAVVGWPGSGEQLRLSVEAALRDELDLPVAVLVRSAAELDAVVADNPFEVEDPKLLHVVFLSGPPPELEVDQLLPDRVAPGPECLYVAFASGFHDSKASKLLSSKRFPLVASARNWRTVLALQELAAQG
jgi:uncharacterized protein (DUF1697 family)